MTGCSYCGRPGCGYDECPERLEDKLGVPSDYDPDCEGELKTDGGTSTDGVDRPTVGVDTLEYDGAETHTDSDGEVVTRHYYECPNCGFPISTWMDCPECLWYDSDTWVNTLAEEDRDV
ncbi:hypothetical protein C479_14148 [Halovivax asiaticus JCM 14624]|uniref:Uncharacterized protein n=1 Tax=Halovivax asiaticus JCM 14624 TaxID=1227490 RepID=M0BDD3_9EURY|nr:hypothetical protein [Halovivax asiaticus]ELZ08487.1 hypothetical protein C479_14148 [Halovivax asiaticus JCM 14624]